MRNNFYPSKPQMTREIEKCIAAGKLETLMSFCNSCVFTIFRKSNEPACRTCTIKQGISRSTKENRAINMRKDEEILSDIIDVLNSDVHC